MPYVAQERWAEALGSDQRLEKISDQNLAMYIVRIYAKWERERDGIFMAGTWLSSRGNQDLL
ncbi:MAG TPA: hypothetical protein VIX17_10380 [Pyrinomonadaceae bacterium]|jgi:hypothetical protein